MNTRKVAIVAGVILVIIGFIYLRPKTSDFHYKYDDAGNIDERIEGLSRENTYGVYLDNHNEAHLAQKDIAVNVTDYSVLEKGEEAVYVSEEENAVYCSENSNVEWKVQIPKAGMYEVYLDYYAPSSRGADIERKFYINGEVPFVGADVLMFTRAWKDKGESTFDNQGNEIRARQVDEPIWMGAYLKDNLGYYTEPYRFYFEEGENTIALEATTEPMLLRKILLKAVKAPESYETYIAKNKEQLKQGSVDEVAGEYKQVIQGEASTYRSSPSLYPSYDRSAPNTEPYSINEIVLNMIGGNAWRVPGQWIEWEFTVPADGFYNLAFKARQNYSRGFVSNRMVYIDGEIPFTELSALQFPYGNDWNSVVPSDKDGNPYNIYLTKGTHNLRMEVTLGELGSIVNDMEDSVYQLNTVYRKILVLTGATPDAHRDYQIDKVYPEVIQAMDMESKRLYRLVDRAVAYAGQKASQIAATQTLAEQLERFVEDPDDIAKSFSNFKDNISALGTSTRTLSEAPLDIDLITITGTDVNPDPVKTNFMSKAIHETRSFIASFVNDYNTFGNVYDDDEVVEVWILTGRDQSSILKSMIDEDFTPNSGIPVNLKLVEAGTVLNAVIAGKGPDVVVSMAQPEPVNYALRNAVEDLTQFDDYKDVLNNFNESAYASYWFEDGLYALPETQNFNVLFYRKDILAELGLDVPNTWNDLINMLPTIQQENLSVAIPSTERIVNNVATPDISCLLALNYQNGGKLYNEDGTEALLDSGAGISAFETYTDFFNQYGLPKTYDFPNRFRSGEMPIGIQDYSMYNTLVVFAPEIRGLWDFTMIPGTLKEDGSLDRSTHTAGLNCIMLNQEDEAHKQKAWTFMKWWVSADAQRTFGMEMESVMGASARYATANLEAFEGLTWSNDQQKVLESQREQTVGQMEIAGGYYTPRHITNAVRKVINDHDDAREVLLDYVITINEEIKKKREEFGLEVK